MFTDSRLKRSLQTLYFGGGLCPSLLMLWLHFCWRVTNLHAPKGTPSIIILMSCCNKCHLFINGATDLAFRLTYCDHGL
jgi:hypothetical protein